MSIVEITGIPGSGKSTVANKIFENLDNLDIKYIKGNYIEVSLFKILSSFFLFLLVRPKELLLVVKFVYKRLVLHRASDIPLMLLRYGRTIAQYNLSLTKFANEIVIFDEGYLHRFHTFGIFEPDYFSEDYMHLYYKVPIKSSLLIILDIDTELALSRIRTRGLPSRWVGIGHEHKLIEMAKKINDYIIRNCENLSKSSYIMTEGKHVENIIKIIKKINR